MNQWIETKKPTLIFIRRKSDIHQNSIKYGSVKDQFIFQTLEEAFKLYITLLALEIVKFINETTSKLIID